MAIFFINKLLVRDDTLSSREFSEGGRQRRIQPDALITVFTGLFTDPKI